MVLPSVSVTWDNDGNVPRWKAVLDLVNRCLRRKHFWKRRPCGVLSCQKQADAGEVPEHSEDFCFWGLAFKIPDGSRQ